MAQQPPQKDGAEPNPAEPSAQQMADDALRAAESAVSGLGSDPHSAPTEADLAALQAAGAAAAGAKAAADSGALPFSPPAFDKGDRAEAAKGIDLLSDVNLNVKIELGRTRMLVEDVLKLSEGAVIELDKLAGDPVEVYVNDRPVAKGEVLVLNDNFCVRINEIIGDPESQAAEKRAS